MPNPRIITRLIHEMQELEKSVAGWNRERTRSIGRDQALTDVRASLNGWIKALREQDARETRPDPSRRRTKAKITAKRKR